MSSMGREGLISDAEAAPRPDSGAVGRGGTRPDDPPGGSPGAATQTRTATRTPLPPAPPRARQTPRRVLKRRVTVRKLDPWSVLKLSVIFYFFALLLVMLAVTGAWAVVQQLGLVDTLLAFLADLQLIVEINPGNIARAIFLVGLLAVVLFSGVNVFLCFLYNLVADLVGGLRMTLAEED